MESGPPPKCRQATRDDRGRDGRYEYNTALGSRSPRWSLHASHRSLHPARMPTDEEAAIRAHLAKLAAEGRHVEREAVAWQLADYIMRGPVGFNPPRRIIEWSVPRLRYPIIEAS